MLREKRGAESCRDKETEKRSDGCMQVRYTLRALGFRADRQVQNTFTGRVQTWAGLILTTVAAVQGR